MQRRSFALMFGLALLIGVPVLWAQAPDVQPARAGAAVPVVSFELDWPQADPQSFSVSLASTGTTSYKSQPRSDSEDAPGDAFTMQFTASQATADRVFELAKDLNYFEGDFEFKGKIANTGAKTLTYHDGPKTSRTTLNYSGNPKMTELISMFQRISSTLEFGRRLAYQVRFDKLGVESILKRMEEMNKDGMLLEIQALEPVLKQIATDRSFLNVSRQRAQRLLGLQAASTGSQ